MKRYNKNVLGMMEESDIGSWVSADEAQGEIDAKERQIAVLLNNNVHLRRIKKACADNVVRLVEEYEKAINQAKSNESKASSERAYNIMLTETIVTLHRIIGGLVLIVVIGIVAVAS